MIYKCEESVEERGKRWRLGVKAVDGTEGGTIILSDGVPAAACMKHPDQGHVKISINRASVVYSLKNIHGGHQKYFLSTRRASSVEG